MSANRIASVFWATLLLLILSLPTQAQSRADIGLKLSATDREGNDNPNIGITGNVLFRFGDNVIDATGDFVFRSVKIQADDGKAISTRILYRRYMVGPVYAVTGMSAVHLMTSLFAETATNALVGGGIELGSVRLQATWSAPDFTSIHEVSAYNLEGEYLHRLKSRGLYVAVRVSGSVDRFKQQRGVSSFYDTLTGSRVAFAVSGGRFLGE